MSGNKECVWREDLHHGDVFSTSCDEMFVFIDGNPESNNFRFCPYCGGSLQPTSHGAVVSDA